MNVITAANERYAYFLETFEEGVVQNTERFPYVYDLGLATPDEYVTVPLSEVGIPWKGKEISIDDKGEIINRGKAIDFGRKMPKSFLRPRAIFKPFCIAHYLKAVGEPCWWMDVDTVLRARLEVADADVAFTLRPEAELKPDNEYWGLINAGVMYWGGENELLEAWVAECMKEELSDQGAMNRVLMREIDFTQDLYDKVVDWRGVRVKFLRTSEYNDHHFGDESKAWHFKFATPDDDEKRAKYNARVKAMNEKHGDIYSIGGAQG